MQTMPRTANRYMRARRSARVAQIARDDVAILFFAKSAALVVLLAFILFLLSPRTAEAMDVKQIKTKSGIEAWLVEDHSVPLVSLKFAFEGGSSQDPVGKEGLANFLTSMLDEGAGDLDSNAFQEKLEDLAIRMSFTETKDGFYGNFQTLTKNLAPAADLLRLAVTKPRFDQDAIERMRKQLLASLAFAARSPDRVAAKTWYQVAFDGHLYARPSNGTEESVKAITQDDLAQYRNRVFARNTLKVAVVGDIDEATLTTLLDQVFGDLPAKSDLVDVPLVAPVKGGLRKVVEMNVPQSVAVFGLGAMARKDPDFMPAFVLNHIIGGGGFASRLMEEVREKRGLAYSVYSYILPYKHTSVYTGGVATRNDAIDQSLDVIRKELASFAKDGPTQEEFDNAKSYLIGSYALRFDTGGKIASQMLGLMEEGFAPDYIDNRNKMIEEITIDDVKRVAKRLLDTENLIVTIVGKPEKPGDKS